MTHAQHFGADPAGDEDGRINGFSDFIVYVDESGDHGMRTLDSAYPIFVLAFCVFYKRHYSEKVVPALHRFKFKHFGHDLVVLHEHEIRKEKGDFKFQSHAHKYEFLAELTGLIEATNFVLISCVIDKETLRSQASFEDNPYHLALGFCLETLYEFLLEKGQIEVRTHVVVECRGKKEDSELEFEFYRIRDGANCFGERLPFDIIFADKKVNCAGLQMADLVARPVGLRVLRPDQQNRAFDVLERKFFCRGGRERVGTNYESWGLKIFPNAEFLTQKSERP